MYCFAQSRVKDIEVTWHRALMHQSLYNQWGCLWRYSQNFEVKYRNIKIVFCLSTKYIYQSFFKSQATCFLFFYLFITYFIFYFIFLIISLFLFCVNMKCTIVYARWEFILNILKLMKRLVSKAENTLVFPW